MSWRSQAVRNVCWLQYFALKQWSHRLRQLSFLVLFAFLSNLTQLLQCLREPRFHCHFFSHLLASLKPGSLLLNWIGKLYLNYYLCLLCYTYLDKMSRGIKQALWKCSCFINVEMGELPQLVYQYEEKIFRVTDFRHTIAETWQWKAGKQGKRNSNGK